MKKKIEITENTPLTEDWVYDIHFGEAPGDVVRIGYDDPNHLDKPAWIRRHAEQELSTIHSTMSTWWGTRAEIPPVEASYVSECLGELDAARTESINERLTADQIDRQIDRWYDEEIHADTSAMRDIASMMRLWWLTHQTTAPDPRSAA